MSEDLDVRDLLTIDVASEIRKLGRAEALTPEQIPAEAVRRSQRARARKIDVRLSARAIEIVDDSVPPPESSLVALAALLDDALPAAQRHAALLKLERSSERAWVALAGAGSEVLIETSSSTSQSPSPAARPRSNGYRLEARPGGRPTLAALSISRSGNRLVLTGRRLKAPAVRAALENVCRFAFARVCVDASPLTTGFDSAVAERALRSPLRGKIALSGSAEEARVWLLMHGSVAAHVGFPHQPGYEAALEMSGRVPEGAPPAALREAAAPLVPELLQQFAELLEREARSLGLRSPEQQARVRRGVLRACVAGIDALADLPVLPVAGRADRRFSLEELRALVSRAGVITTLFPDQLPDRFRLPAEPTFVLDAYERDLIAKLADVRFAAPQRRSPPTWRRRFATLRAGWRAALGRASASLPTRHRALPSHVLSAAERALLAALGAPPEGAPFQAVALRAGRGRVTIRSRCLWLPREDELVRAATRALSEDGAAWVYPAALALLGAPGGVDDWIDGWRRP